MSVGYHRGKRHEQRKKIIAHMEEEAARHNMPLDLFWAKLDTMLQLTPGGRTRDERHELLCTVFPNWLEDIPFHDLKLYEYDRLMMPGIYMEHLDNPNLVLLQIGSLGAKILWADLRHARTKAGKMFELCLKTLKESPAYKDLSERRQVQLRTDLSIMIHHYANEAGFCSKDIRNFFKSHHEEYMNVMDILSQKLLDENVPEQEAAPVLPALQSEAEAPEDQTKEKSLLEPPLPAEIDVAAVDDTDAPIAAEVAIPQPVPAGPGTPNTADAYRTILSRLDRLDASIAKLIPQDDEFDDNASGLCHFVEKTASFRYNRPLSKLYQLYTSMPEQISAKELEIILRSFFHALRLLEIEPIDDKRHKEEFPEEYLEEMARRGKTPFRYTMCGWSYGDSMLIAPQYEEDKRNVHE